MLKDNDEIAFYLVSGIAFSLSFWAFGLFKLDSFPLAAPLMLSCFSLNLLLTHVGEKMLGPESDDAPVKIVFACSAAAFFLAWAANLNRDVLGSLALPAAIMYLLPSVLYYVRQAILRSEVDVQA